jgi:hypothetical protein
MESGCRRNVLDNGASSLRQSRSTIQKTSTPKVFVSYAQSEQRTEWIREVCERLLHDGVDVVADFYELPHGADIHSGLRMPRYGIYPSK